MKGVNNALLKKALAIRKNASRGDALTGMVTTGLGAGLGYWLNQKAADAAVARQNDQSAYQGNLEMSALGKVRTALQASQGGAATGGQPPLGMSPDIINGTGVDPSLASASGWKPSSADVAAINPSAAQPKQIDVSGLTGAEAATPEARFAFQQIIDSMNPHKQAMEQSQLAQQQANTHLAEAHARMFDARAANGGTTGTQVFPAEWFKAQNPNLDDNTAAVLSTTHWKTAQEAGAAAARPAQVDNLHRQAIATQSLVARRQALTEFQNQSLDVTKQKIESGAYDSLVKDSSSLAVAVAQLKANGASPDLIKTLTDRSGQAAAQIPTSRPMPVFAPRATVPGATSATPPTGQLSPLPTGLRSQLLQENAATIEMYKRQNPQYDYSSLTPASQPSGQ